MGMCKKNSLLSICFVVRRVVAVGCAGIFFDIRFGHCTSCLFDNSSVKLCKHDTPLLFAPSGANHEQGLGQARPNKITSEMQTHCRSEVPLYRCAQNRFRVIVSELLRCKNK